MCRTDWFTCNIEVEAQDTKCAKGYLQLFSTILGFQDGHHYDEVGGVWYLAMLTRKFF